MRSLRSVVGLVSTLIVMGCQTIAAPGSASRPGDSSFSSIAPTTIAAREKSYSAAEMGGSRKKLILVGAAVVAIVIAAIIISGGDGESGRGY